MELGKKAQPSGGAAAALVIIICAFILMYILFLPNSERNRLLEISETPDVVRDVTGSVLLLERPGTLTKPSESEFAHTLEGFSLLAIKEDIVIKKSDSLYIDAQTPARVISVDSARPAENARLSFNVQSGVGTLTIRLNGEQVFKGKAASAPPILALGALSEHNTLEFSVDKPASWMFWKHYAYDIRNIQVSATTINTEKSTATQTFVVGSDESDPQNIENAYITYYVDCASSEQGVITTTLNRKMISAKVPDCSSVERIFLTPSDLVEGRNELAITASEGRYIIGRLVVRINLKEPVFPLYFFDINQSQYSRIRNNTINASIKIFFSENSERKRAVIKLNSHQLSLDTRADSYAKNIDEFVTPASNSLSIEPTTILHITQMSISLDCHKETDCK